MLEVVHVSRIFKPTGGPYVPTDAAQSKGDPW